MDGRAVEPAELQEALWDLVWAGEVTNDACAPLRAPRLSLARGRAQRAPRAAAASPAAAGPAAPQIQGRWSLTAPLFARRARPRPARMRATSEILLERYGIVTREQALAEGIPGGFSAVYPELANLETLGTARRGYFVEGLGGAQFALAAAVERLRGLRSDEPAGGLVLAATDPANPYGASLPWPKRDDDAAAAPAARAGRLRRHPRRRARPLRRALRQGPDRAARSRRAASDLAAEALEALADAVRRGRLPCASRSSASTASRSSAPPTSRC